MSTPHVAIGNPGEAATDMVQIDAMRLAALLPMVDAVDALERALLAGLDPEADPPRIAVPLLHGELLIMSSTSQYCVGVKTVTVAPDNPAVGRPRIQALYFLYDVTTLSPVALIDGTALTNVRTPATSALAIRHLSRPSAEHVHVFGTGPQAWGHVEAVRTVRPISSVKVTGADEDGVNALVEHCRKLGLKSEAAAPDEVKTADIVICCTSSSEPLFDGQHLRGNAMVVAVGSHTPSSREIDDTTISRSTVVVETAAVALREAGDIIIPHRSGVIAADDLHELASVVRTPMRFTGPRLFKSVGMAWQDLVVASEAVERLQNQRAVSPATPAPTT